MRSSRFLFAAALLGLLASCNPVDDIPGFGEGKQKKIDFDVMVTRDGKVVTKAGSGVMMTKAGESYSASDNIATMDTDIPFGLIGIDAETHEIVVDNKAIHSDGSGSYSSYFDQFFWGEANKINFSAYYPHVGDVTYGARNESYAIPYSVRETEAGPLVSKTVQKAIDQLNMVPLVFQHITNDIGFKICDVTPMEELQGLIHLRKLTATNVAQAGVFVNDVEGSTGSWQRQAYYTRIVVFDGDAKVGVGSENEQFVGYDTLVDHMAESHRYYSIPDDIEIGKQCVEVVFDVDGFEHGGFDYPPLKEQVFKYMLYGLLPDNEFVYGKQYTFHIGLDLSSVYHQITFAPSVSEWETKIYENNEDF